MKFDDSFKTPGSVPFKWEIRPGVPKTTLTQPGRHQSESGSKKQHQTKAKQPPITTHNHPLPETQRKLKPPPAGLYFQPQMEPRNRAHSVRSSHHRAHSARSLPRALSIRFGLPGLARPGVVSSAGCFPAPIGKLKNAKKKGGNPRSIPEPDYYTDLETSSRWSVSSRKSVFSTLPSSFSSHQSSPLPVYDKEWAGFGLF